MQNQTPPKDNQDAFNRVWQHFIVEENPRCRNIANNLCVYYAPNNGCAVGCMLPPELAKLGDASEDGNSIAFVVSDYKSIANWFKNVDLILLSALQKWHDGDNSTKHLREITGKFKLTIPEEQSSPTA